MLLSVCGVGLLSYDASADQRKIYSSERISGVVLEDQREMAQRMIKKIAKPQEWRQAGMCGGTPRTRCVILS